MVTVQSFSDMVEKDVFTTKGKYAGKVTDLGLDMERFRVRSIIVDAIKGSFLADMVGAKKGVVVPFELVQSIGDVVIMQHVSPTTVDENGENDKEPEPINF